MQRCLLISKPFLLNYLKPKLLRSQVEEKVVLEAALEAVLGAHREHHPHHPGAGAAIAAMAAGAAGAAIHHWYRVANGTEIRTAEQDYPIDLLTNLEQT